MAAVMLAGAPLCNEAFAASNSIEASAFADNVVLANGVKFVIKLGTDKYLQTTTVKNDAAKTTYAVKKAEVTIDKATVLEVVNYQKTVLGATFSISVDGKIYACLANGTAIADNTAKNDIKTIFQVTSTATNGNFTLKDLKAKVFDGSAEIAAGNFQTLSLNYADDNLSEFNANATTFSFLGENLEGNVFNSVVPFTFGVDALGTGSAAGTYFVKGAADDVKALKTAQNADARKAALKKLSVVAVMSDVYGINTSVPGEGYKLALISGADFYKDENAANFKNSAFQSIKEADQLNNAGEILLTIKPVIKNVVDGDKVFAIKSVKASASDTKTYVTTVADSTPTRFAQSSNPTLGANTYFAASEFLKAGEISAYNIYATSAKKADAGDKNSEYHKYYVTGPKSDNYAAGYENSFKAANDAQLTNPAAQWIVTGFDGKYTLTLKNRLNNNQTLTLRLAATDNAGEYAVSGTGAGTLEGTTIKLLPATLTKYDGSLELSKEQMEEGVTLSFSGKNASIGEQTFYASLKTTVTGSGSSAVTTYSVIPALEESNVIKFKVERATEDKKDLTYNVLPYAYLDAAGAVVSSNEAKADTLIVPVYKFSYTIKDTKYVVKNNFVLDTNKDNASFYWINKTLDGSYTLNYTTAAQTDYDVHVGATSAIGVEATTSNAVDAKFNIPTNQYYTPSDAMFDKLGVNDVDNFDYASLPAVSRHATFEAVNVAGGITMQENKNGILEGIIGAEPATFWLDTADSEKNVPTFYISKGIAKAEETKAYSDEVRNFLVYAPDSLSYFDEASATYKKDKAYKLEGTDDLKAFFRPAALIAEDTLTTVVNGKEVVAVTEKADPAKNQKNVLKNFQFGIRLANEKVADEYVIYSKANTDKYLYSHNGKLGFGSKAEALVVKLGEGDATANEAIAAENVAVIAGEGVVTVKGAAGKQVVVSNILGQVIANKVATSDEETIAVAAGVAVVVVDGEATKVVVK